MFLFLKNNNPMKHILFLFLLGSASLYGQGVMPAYRDGWTHLFNPSNARAGLNIGSNASDPLTLNNGDLWYNTAIPAIRMRVNGVSVSLHNSGTILSPSAGGTGINNGSNTLTLSGQYTLAGQTGSTLNMGSGGILQAPAFLAGTASPTAADAGEVVLYGPNGDVLSNNTITALVPGLPTSYAALDSTGSIYLMNAAWAGPKTAQFPANIPENTAWTFASVEGIASQGYLLGTNNLSDINDGAAALANIGGQAIDPELTALAALSSTANKFPTWTGVGTAANADITAAGLALLDDANAAAQIVTLGAAKLTTNTFTGLQTITQGTANTGVLASTGYSLTGADTTSMINLAGTWNTSGNADALTLNITNTASGASSNLLNLKVGGSSLFRVTKAGDFINAGGLTIAGSANIGPTSSINWGSGTNGTLNAVSNGVWRFANAAGTDATRLILGTNDASGVSLSKSATTMTVGLGDGTAGGTFAVSGTALFSDGTAAAPGIAFGGNPAVGFKRNAAWITAYGGGSQFLWTATSNLFGIPDNASLSWVSGGESSGSLSLRKLAAQSLVLGAANSATPLANTLTIGESSRAGTDTNVAGANGTVASGTGTGTGAVSSFIIQTPSLGGAGSVAQALANRVVVKEGLTDFSTNVKAGVFRANYINSYDNAVSALNIADVTGDVTFGGKILNLDGTPAAPSITNTGDTDTGFSFATADTIVASTGGTARWTLNSTGVTVAGAGAFGGAMTASACTATGDLTAGAAAAFAFGATRSFVTSPADGQIRLTNAAGTDFTRLQFGGTTASFPAIKRSATALNFRLADDTADAPITAGAGTFSGNVSASSSRITAGADATGGAGFGLSGVGYLSGTGGTTGVMQLLNIGVTGFNRLQFGGITSSFPAIKRVGAEFQVTHAATTAADNAEAGDSEMSFIQDRYRRKGAGTPEAAVTAPVGAIYHRTDGGAGTSFYVKESGAGNTGWVAK